MRETDPAEIIIGVDTHKQTHAAVAISGLGARLGILTLPASLRGYQELETWARSFGPVRTFGIEGTGSYGAGLSRFLQERGHSVIEVNRPNRQVRHQHGKTDPLDAENAARSAPKSGTSSVEMIRHLKVARDTAVKSRTQAMVTLKTIIINAPAASRECLEGLTGTMALIRHLAALRPGAMTSPTASAKATLRALARRWLMLHAEIKSHDAALDALTTACAPVLKEAHGMSTGTAAEMLILVGDNPERIRFESAFAKLCGACPIPASSGKSTRHRLTRGGNRQAGLPHVGDPYVMLIQRWSGRQLGSW
ncbi:IS110 family transposase [Microvirga sp. Mcv34]|uniref:IS110 family transposase n=1 Tax=Microvirga sp. Mcv34 TaxID=2926016 RepID=UPI0021C8D5BF|nr:transposase [Microvirga sp. Mcv34]